MLMRRILDLFRAPAKPEQIKPKHVMEDEFFGKLTWNENHPIGWRGVMTLANGKTAVLTFDAAKADESMPEAVRDTGKFLIANEPLIRHKIAVSMSELYNGTWSGGDDAITPEEMAQRISLYEVSFYEDGDGELLYEAADNLFTDHTICVPIAANGEIGEPELEG